MLGIYTCYLFITGVKGKWRPSHDEADQIIRNREKVKVECIGTIKLKLEFGFCLDLVDIVYVPSMRCSLISCSRLDNWVTVLLKKVYFS